MTTVDFLLFGCVITILLLAGMYKSKKIQSESAYLFAERKISWAALTATLVMTEFNSATLISFSSLGYGAGFWALLLPLIFLVGLIFYALTVAKKWKEFDGMSVAGFFTQRYGRNIGRCASILLMMAMLGFSAAYIKSLTLIFHPLVPTVDPWIISGSLMVIVLAMSLRGGLIAIIKTDRVSLILMVLFFPAMALWMWKSPHLLPLSYPESFASEKILPWRFVFSLTILTMFTYILAPWYGQKIFAARSGKVAYWSVIAAAVLIFFLYGSAIAATAFFRYRGYESPSWEHALPALIDRCLPQGFKGFAFALLFATSATALTGVWNAMTAMWVGDFREHAGGLKRTTLCFAAISYLLANTLVDKVFDKLILANIPVAALSFGLLAGFYWKKTSIMGVYLSILMGCIAGIGSYWLYGEAGGYTWYWAVYGVPLIFVAGILGSIQLPQSSLSR